MFSAAVILKNPLFQACFKFLVSSLFQVLPRFKLVSSSTSLFQVLSACFKFVSSCIALFQRLFQVLFPVSSSTGLVSGLFQVLQSPASSFRTLREFVPIARHQTTFPEIRTTPVGGDPPEEVIMKAIVPDNDGHPPVSSFASSARVSSSVCSVSIFSSCDFQNLKICQVLILKTAPYEPCVSCMVQQRSA